VNRGLGADILGKGDAIHNFGRRNIGGCRKGYRHCRRGGVTINIIGVIDVVIYGEHVEGGGFSRGGLFSYRSVYVREIGVGSW